jgi:hypothetical protein
VAEVVLCLQRIVIGISGGKAVGKSRNAGATGDRNVVGVIEVMVCGFEAKPVKDFAPLDIP